MTIIEGFYIGTFKDNVFVMGKNKERMSFKASENLVSFIANLYKLYEPIKLEVDNYIIRKIVF